MGGCMGQWVGSGQMTNLIKLELINIIWFCLKIYNLSRHPYLWVDGWVNGWAHVKPPKSNKSWPNRDNSIMDILDILLDILLKPPQPFIGLFFIFIRINCMYTIFIFQCFGHCHDSVVHLDSADALDCWCRCLVEHYPVHCSVQFWYVELFFIVIIPGSVVSKSETSCQKCIEKSHLFLCILTKSW